MDYFFIIREIIGLNKKEKRKEEEKKNGILRL